MNNPNVPSGTLRDVASAKSWLARQPLANPAQLQAALATEIGHLNQGSLPASTRLQIMEFLREAVHFAQTEVAKKYVGRALPLSPPEQASFDASRALWQLFGDGYRLCLEAAEAGDGECRAQAGMIAQRALACAAMLQYDSYRAQHEVGNVFWQDAHRLYAAAERLDVVATEVEDPLRVAMRTTTPTAMYALILVLFAASPFELTLRQVTTLRRWIGRWSGKIGILRGPAPAEEVAALPLDLAGASPAGVTNTNGPGLRWLDLTAMRSGVRTRLHKLKEGVTPADLKLGEDVSSEAAEELLMHLYRHASRNALPRAHPRRVAQGEVKVVSGFAAIHYHISGRVFREPGTTSTMTRQHAAELATLGRVATAEDEARAAREYAPESWRLVDQSPGGLRVAREGGGPQRRIGAGQLIALKGPTDETYLLAITRWLVAMGGNEFQMGVQLIPGSALGCTARSLEFAGRETFDRAFVMPEIAKLSVPASIILPLNAFRSPRDAELIDPTLGKMRLTALIQRGLDYDRVAFEPAT